MNPQPQHRVNILNFIDRVERKKEEKLSLIDYLKKFIELLPIISLFLLITSFASMIGYYFPFGFNPLKYYTLSELVMELSDVLIEVIKIILISILYLSSFLFLGTKVRSLSLKTQRTILNVYFFIILLIFLYLADQGFIPIGGSLYISFLPAVYTTLLLYQTRKTGVYSVVLSTYKLLIFAPVIFVVCILLSIENGFELKHKYKRRNIYLKTKDFEVKAYDKSRYIIGNTAQRYFVYDAEAFKTKIINSEEVEDIQHYYKFKYRGILYHKFLSLKDKFEKSNSSINK